MGCDIHLMCEKKIKYSDEEYWWCCDHFQYNEYKRFEEPDYHEPLLHIAPIYDWRNYELFTALADVRHRDGIAIIDKPRGLPDDVSDVVKECADDWGVDGHSHSWLTAKELFVYQNRHPFTNHSGMVDGEDLRNLDEAGIPPECWCQWTNDKNAQWRSWSVPGSVVDKLVDAVKKRMREEFWIFDFMKNDEAEKKLWDNAENFRIVFWFDN